MIRTDQAGSRGVQTVPTWSNNCPIRVHIQVQTGPYQSLDRVKTVRTMSRQGPDSVQIFMTGYKLSLDSPNWEHSHSRYGSHTVKTKVWSKPGSIQSGHGPNSQEFNNRVQAVRPLKKHNQYRVKTQSKQKG